MIDKRKIRKAASLAFTLVLVLVFQYMVFADEKKADVEINSLRTAMSPSGNWVDITFLIKNNCDKHIRYVVVELAGWDKKKDGDLMISDDYMSDPIPPKGRKAVTFSVRYVRGATYWTARVVKIKYK